MSSIPNSGFDPAKPQPGTPSQRVKNNRRWIILAALLVTALIIILLVVFSKKNKNTLETANTSQTHSTQNGQPQSALTVTVTQPENRNWEKTLEANGNIAAWQEVVIGSELSGLRITQVNVNVGDVVKRGQLLAQINADTIQAELAQSKATIAEAQAVLNDAIADARRIQALKNTGAISAQEAAQYLTTQQTAQARLDLARAQIESSNIRLAQTRVVAPDDGVISGRTATVGSLAQAGQELFRMIRDNRLEWRAEVTTSELYRLKPSMKVSMISADPNQPPISGTVRMIAPTINNDTRYGLVYVDLPRSNALRMGMFVKGTFQLGAQQAVTLPQSSLLLRDGFAYVFILDSQNRVHQQKIETGRRVGDRVEVMGLPANVRVVASGTAFLTDGDTVKVAAAIPQTPLNRQFAAGDD
ncbi:efflux RND transporter periplasmic adaptor subunit [Alkanindiges illinoisensis]|uniref:Efflux RND transporter periplasmic adaptor subunit n=1 Tax=Alkanindiges illinoisensis TaxID=197183 RepID=A0A4Y7XFB0_9GAMM|nr:efflux RND transporter periplasmic adaptor subunit [Alkanindiges illinoisensis]TEU30521.1 efflux RND transporter periplasmic adaptor subunit [Alkanindiges illinoisensis]